MSESLEKFQVGDLPASKFDKSVEALSRTIFENYNKALWSEWNIYENLWPKNILYINPKKLDRVNPVQINVVLKFLNISVKFSNEELKELCVSVLYHLLLNSTATIDAYHNVDCYEIGEKMLDEAVNRARSEYVDEAVKRVRFAQKIDRIRI